MFFVGIVIVSVLVLVFLIQPYWRNISINRTRKKCAILTNITAHEPIEWMRAAMRLYEKMEYTTHSRKKGGLFIAENQEYKIGILVTEYADSESIKKLNDFRAFENCDVSILYYYDNRDSRLDGDVRSFQKLVQKVESRTKA